MCPGCYKESKTPYCRNCRAALFDGAKVDHTLQVDAPRPGNLPEFQEKTQRLSISGVQLKYSLRLVDRDLEFTEKGGQYILKPIPPNTLIDRREEVPENEHLTMQLASQVFGIKTAANMVIFFKDQSPAYLTRRFDVKPDGSKFLQEDMAQLSGRSRQADGEDFKYQGTYADIGALIQQYVAAYPLALEELFRLILFNYLFSNGDAHLKNFSLIQTAMGDYALTPAYDLLSTVLHTPGEADTALELYEGDMDSAHFSSSGCYGRPDFLELANRLGIQPHRATQVLENALDHREEVEAMIARSYLTPDSKALYLRNYLGKRARFMME